MPRGGFYSRLHNQPADAGRLARFSVEENRTARQPLQAKLCATVERCLRPHASILRAAAAKSSKIGSRLNPPRLGSVLI